MMLLQLILTKPVLSTEPYTTSSASPVNTENLVCAGGGPGMEALRLREFRAVSAFLRELYAAPGLKGFQSHMLSALPRLFPAETVSYNEVNPGARRNDYVKSPSLPSQYEPVFLRHMGEHPLIIHYSKTRDGRALRISDVLAPRRFRRTALYNEYFRPLRLEYQLACTLPGWPPLVVGMALTRNGRDFSDRETHLLNLLRPHLVQAYRNAESATRLREELATITRTLDEVSCGIIFLSPEGRTRLANAQAVRMLAAYCGRSARRGDPLPAEMRAWLRRAVEARSAPPIVWPRSPLVIEREARRLVVRLVGGTEERLLLLEEQMTAPSPHALLALGLTRREADVMSWVAHGKTNREIARILGISPLTVVKHLQHIFEKFGVRTRTAAAMKALRAPTISAT